MSYHKVIGYFAYHRGGEVICDGDSCIIAGSEEKMKAYIAAYAGKITNPKSGCIRNTGQPPKENMLSPSNTKRKRRRPGLAYIK